MKRTVVYGLGRLYRRCARTIERDRNVVAHCDRNPEVVKEFADGITVKELMKNIESYDEVFVATSLMKVYAYLVDELRVPQKTINALGHADVSFAGGNHPRDFTG